MSNVYERDIGGIINSTYVINIHFSLLMKGRANQHPADNDFIIIYILGGISTEEIKNFQDVISIQKTHCQVILAGSRLLSPLDVTNDVLLGQN